VHAPLAVSTGPTSKKGRGERGKRKRGKGKEMERGREGMGEEKREVRGQPPIIFWHRTAPVPCVPRHCSCTQVARWEFRWHGRVVQTAEAITR